MNVKLMIRRTVWVLCAGLGVAFVATATASEMGMAAANEVSLTSYQGFLNNSLYTHNGHSRGQSGAQHDPARDNIKAILESYGLAVQLEAFNYGGQTWENVVATQVGTLYPGREYIVGGHYDSANNPGADDDASGVAAVLEAARILSQYPSQCTIRYVAFDMEEAGLVGSEAYVSQHTGADIRGMISADMICYDPNTNHARIFGRTASNPIKNALAAAVTEYGNGLTYTIGGQADFSDHAPFEWAGYQACCFIEGDYGSNPYYHTQQDSYDTAGYLNFAYAVKMVRSVVGYLVDAAGVIVPIDDLQFDYPNGLPQLCDPSGGTTVRVEVTGLGSTVPQPGTGKLHYNIGGGWQVVPMLVVANNVYDAVFPAAACGTDVLYYFSAEAVGGQVHNDPPNAPTTVYAATAAYGHVVFYENLFNTDPAWTKQGLWAFGQPTGGGGEHGGPDPTAGHTGTKVYGYNLSGDYENNLPERHLTSTAIDCTGMYGVHLSFWRWLGVEQSQYDHAYVRVSNNGTNYTTVWQNTGEVADTSWQQIDLDISAVADNKPTVYLRWTMGTTDGGWRYCGWNVDDVTLTALDCEPPFVRGDLDCNGVVNAFDIDPFVLALTDPTAYQQQFPLCEIMAADIDCNGIVNAFDIDPFVICVTVGCAPCP